MSKYGAFEFFGPLNVALKLNHFHLRLIPDDSLTLGRLNKAFCSSSMMCSVVFECGHTQICLYMFRSLFIIVNVYVLCCKELLLFSMAQFWLFLKVCKGSLWFSVKSPSHVNLLHNMSIHQVWTIMSPFKVYMVDLTHDWIIRTACTFPVFPYKYEKYAQIKLGYLGVSWRQSVDTDTKQNSKIVQSREQKKSRRALRGTTSMRGGEGKEEYIAHIVQKKRVSPVYILYFSSHSLARTPEGASV